MKYGLILTRADIAGQIGAAVRADPDDALVEQASYDTTSVYGFGHPLYYDNVIKALRGEAMPETDGREGLHSLELLIATYLSARDGRRVALPLEY
jgi:UDP-N-acetyl-2-amino-2-deoxyglucuronate dehydrogenase